MCAGPVIATQGRSTLLGPPERSIPYPGRTSTNHARIVSGSDAWELISGTGSAVVPPGIGGVDHDPDGHRLGADRDEDGRAPLQCRRRGRGPEALYVPAFGEVGRQNGAGACVDARCSGVEALRAALAERVATVRAPGCRPAERGPDQRECAARPRRRGAVGADRGNRPARGARTSAHRRCAHVLAPGPGPARRRIPRGVLTAGTPHDVARRGGSGCVRRWAGPPVAARPSRSAGR